MKDYYVIWTYVANYSSMMVVSAEDEVSACEKVYAVFGQDFRKRATVYVWSTPPAYIGKNGPTLKG
jgi:hypothetical protein